MIIRVLAGVLPDNPEIEHVREWVITDKEWEEAGDGAPELLAQRNGQAQGYAALLMLRPDRFNWVRLDWTWL